MDRKFIPAFALRVGQRAYIEPKRDGLPRGPKLEGEIAAGEVTVTPWVFDLVRRGQALAFSGPPAALSADEIDARRKEIIESNEMADELASDELATMTDKAIKAALKSCGESHV